MKLTHLGAAALMAAWALPATAADLGGNCCADLEERVAELEATTARKGNRKVSLEVSGHVNQAILFWDGFGALGSDLDDTAIVNNSNSTSRFRFRGSAAIDTNWSAGFLMEFGAGDINNSGGLNIRHQALYIKSKQLGTVWVGKTSTATDGIMELSLASSDASTLGSLAPFDAFFASQTGLSISSPFDGNRENTLRYISPTMAGFVFSAAWIDKGDSSWDMALRYAGEFGSIRVAAGIGYRKEDVSADIAFTTKDDREFVGGSGSIMHVPSGVFLDGQYGQSRGLQTITLDLNKLVGGVVALNDLSIGADVDMNLWGGRLGIARKWMSLGTTTIYVEYNQLEIKDVDIDPRVWGVGFVQDIDPAAMSLYMSYRNVDLDLGEDDTADVFLLGAKLKF